MPSGGFPCPACDTADAAHGPGWTQNTDPKEHHVPQEEKPALALLRQAVEQLEAQQAAATDDEPRLVRMQRELDAAATFIETLQRESREAATEHGALAGKLTDAEAELARVRAELTEARNQEPVQVPVEPIAHQDRAELLQIVVRLSQDNPGMTLEDALVFISGAFGGGGDNPLTLPVLEPRRGETDPRNAPVDPALDEDPFAFAQVHDADDQAALGEPREQDPVAWDNGGTDELDSFEQFLASQPDTGGEELYGVRLLRAQGKLDAPDEEGREAA